MYIHTYVCIKYTHTYMDMYTYMYISTEKSGDISPKVARHEDYEI